MANYTTADAKDLLGHLNAHGAGIPDTPQMEQAILAWMKQESGPKYNPLNIMGGFSTGGHHVIQYSSPSAGYEATAKLLTSSKNYTGVIAAGRTGDPLAFLNAVAKSPWDAAHYGINSKTNPVNHLISVYNSLGKNSGTVTLPTTTGGTITVPKGQMTNVDLNPLDAVGGAINAATAQIGDTFTWIGFILVGLVLIAGGIFLMKPQAAGDAIKLGAAAA